MLIKNTAFLIPVLLLLQTNLFAQENCQFNKPIETSTYYGINKSQIDQPSQGWVENFGGIGDRARDTAARLYWGSCADDSGETGVTPGEVFALNCSGIEGNGYSFSELRNLKDFLHRTENHLDDMEEELLFATAARNIHRLASCQQGLFQGYFDAAGTKRNQMLSRAFERFQEKRSAVQKELSDRAGAEASKSRAERFLNCQKDGCLSTNLDTIESVANRDEVEAAIQKSDAKLQTLLSSIPMGNRKGMRDAILQLYRVNPNATLSQFSEVFNREMRKLNSEVESTLETIDSIHHVDKNGSDLYCVDSNLKRQFYQSGQLEIVLQNLELSEHEASISCRMGRRYGMAGEVITELALIPTYFTGYGIARLALSRGVAGVASRGRTALNMSTRLGMMGIQGSDAAMFIDSTARACLSKSFMVGLQGRDCNPENEFSVAMHEAEISQCVANIAFFGMSNASAIRYMRQGQQSIIAKGDTSSLLATSKRLEAEFPVTSTRTQQFGDAEALEQVRTIEGIDEQIDFITKTVPGVDQAQLRYILEEAADKDLRVVFGGSRIRGEGHYREGSDLDVGFHSDKRGFRNLEKRVQSIMKVVNDKEKFPTGLHIEDGVKIFTGNSTPTIPKMASPEEFFMRSGVRQKPDPKAGEAFEASGYMSISPEGEVIIGIPQ